MSEILILGTQQSERQGLAVVLEMAGHNCVEADSLPAAARALRERRADLVLTDSRIGDAGPEEIRRALAEVARDIHILFLVDTEETSGAESGGREITVTTSPLHWLSSQFASVSRPDALAILLPEQDSLRMLDTLPRTPGMLNKLAVLYHSQAKFAIAETLYRQALEAAERTAERTGSGEVASILNNLAGLYTDQKRYADAEALYLKSLSLVEQKYGKVHPKVTTRLMLLSHLYRAQGKGAEAEAVSRRLIG